VDRDGTGRLAVYVVGVWAGWLEGGGGPSRVFAPVACRLPPPCRWVWRGPGGDGGDGGAVGTVSWGSGVAARRARRWGAVVLRLGGGGRGVGAGVGMASPAPDLPPAQGRVYVERCRRAKMVPNDGSLARPSAFGDLRADPRRTHSRTAGCYFPNRREQCGWRADEREGNHGYGSGSRARCPVR
jgi:hypothetical protein